MIDHSSNDIRISKLINGRPVVTAVALPDICTGIQAATSIQETQTLTNTNDIGITKIDIVREGQTIITLTQDDLLNNEYNNYSYTLNDTNNAHNFRVYINNYVNMCYPREIIGEK